METIVIAGGSGLIGSGMAKMLREQGHVVWILSRNSSNKTQFCYHWDPSQNEIDSEAIESATVLINLCGAGLAEKRWTSSRITELFDSRVETTRFLAEKFKHAAHLKHYVSASGAVTYGFDNPDKIYSEKDAFGQDLIGEITKQWEAAADLFQPICKVTKIRISVVLSARGGALTQLLNPIKKGFGAVLGNGKQVIPWIHEQDLHRVFQWTIEESKSGVFHAAAGNTTNEELTKTLAKVWNKKILLPPIPSFVIKLLFGKMSMMLLKGNRVSNETIKNAGFYFQFKELDSTIQRIFEEIKNPSS